MRSGGSVRWSGGGGCAACASVTLCSGAVPVRRVVRRGSHARRPDRCRQGLRGEPRASTIVSSSNDEPGCGIRGRSSLAGGTTSSRDRSCLRRGVVNARWRASLSSLAATSVRRDVGAVGHDRQPRLGGEQVEGVDVRDRAAVPAVRWRAGPAAAAAGRCGRRAARWRRRRRGGAAPRRSLRMWATLKPASRSSSSSERNGVDVTLHDRTRSSTAGRRLSCSHSRSRRADR